MEIHGCGAGHAGECMHGAASLSLPGGAARPFTVDLHCHTLVPAAEALVADTPQKRAEPERALRLYGPESLSHNRDVMLPAAAPKLADLSLRLADMDAMGVDVQVLSPSPTQYHYWAEPDLARESVRLQNEAIAEQCARHPDRLAGMCTVSLQHPDLAVEQLRDAVRRLGLKGLEVSTSVNGLELADRLFDPVWRACEELGVLVFIHPVGTSLGERVNRHYLNNTIGQPLETTVALSYLIFGGTLDRHPGLKVLAAHGGGYLPHYIGRSDHAHAVRPEAAQIAHKPSEYLKRIWFDDLVYEPRSLRHLIDNVGVSQVVVGTDYPFDMGDCNIHGLLNAVPGLSGDDRARILGGNAVELLGLQRQRAAAAHPDSRSPIRSSKEVQP